MQELISLKLSLCMGIYMCQIGLELLHSSKKCLSTLSLLTIFHIREAIFHSTEFIFYLIQQCLFLQLGTGEKNCRTINYFVTATIQLQTFHHRKKKIIEIENSFFFLLLWHFFSSEREINGIGALIYEKKIFFC